MMRQATRRGAPKPPKPTARKSWRWKTPANPDGLSIKKAVCRHSKKNPSLHKHAEGRLKVFETAFAARANVDFDDKISLHLGAKSDFGQAPMQQEQHNKAV